MAITASATASAATSTATSAATLRLPPGIFGSGFADVGEEGDFVIEPFSCAFFLAKFDGTGIVRTARSQIKCRITTALKGIGVGRHFDDIRLGRGVVVGGRGSGEEGAYLIEFSSQAFAEELLLISGQSPDGRKRWLPAVLRHCTKQISPIIKGCGAARRQPRGVYEWFRSQGSQSAASSSAMAR